MKILLFANGSPGVIAAEFLQHHIGIEILYVTTTTWNLVKIRQLGVNYHIFNIEIEDEMLIAENFDPQIVISVGWKYIFKRNFVNKFECYNFHPSLLPLYRGENSIEKQLVNGENVGGITMHRIDERIDTGPIYKQKEITINANDTIETIIFKCNILMIEILKDFLNEYPKIKCYKQMDN